MVVLFGTNVGKMILTRGFISRFKRIKGHLSQTSDKRRVGSGGFLENYCLVRTSFSTKHNLETLSNLSSISVPGAYSGQVSEGEPLAPVVPVGVSPAWRQASFAKKVTSASVCVCSTLSLALPY